MYFVACFLSFQVGPAEWNPRDPLLKFFFRSLQLNEAEEPKLGRQYAIINVSALAENLLNFY